MDLEVSLQLAVALNHYELEMNQQHLYRSSYKTITLIIRALYLMPSYIIINLYLFAALHVEFEVLVSLQSPTGQHTTLGYKIIVLGVAFIVATVTEYTTNLPAFCCYDI